MKIDEQLEMDTGKEALAVMKRKSPPNKSPLFKILGETLGNGAGSGNPADQTIEQMQLDSIGCTANMILVEDMKKLYVANAGDSRCVLSRAGEAVPLSFDHKPENEEERERIEKAGSVITDGRVDGNLNLSRSLGDLKYKQKKELKAHEHPITANPDTYTYDLSPKDDFIIMGCDGIWETKTNQQMVDFIVDRFKAGKSTKTIVAELLEDIISPDYQQTSKLL